MQTFKLLLLTIFSVSTVFANAKTKTETLKVWGNCAMCQSRIEKAAIDAGASNAAWNAETKILTVSYDEAKGSLSAIESKIASVGHDTKNKTASKEAYNKLHGCCQYDRKETASASASCCVAGASCCSSGQSCCTKASSTVKANTTNCCFTGASCCATGKDCCAKSEVSTAAVKNCCAAGASCCVAGAACCNKTAKVASISTSDCCVKGNSCCTSGGSCCAKMAA